MGAERIHVQDLVGLTWLRAWRSGTVTVRFGSTSDGRWIAWHSARGKAYAYWDERAACELGDRWLARGAWSELADTGGSRL
ncbi:hypothetical protein OHA21_06700 [Actinoplanes sp. NBC_00393]|uniref:hypothetical protein n=1 Tax=Actinoplanes sp. NBC_00393 TaxID=2975953 RepID=UPI002E1C58F5